MSVLVVDASVGIKWFVPEPLSTEARLWRAGPDELHVPSFFFELEMANILRKKLRRSEITRTEADQVLNEVSALAVVRHAEANLLISAFDLSIATQRSVYDCLYLSLAMNLGGQMLTAYQKLFNSLAQTRWAGSIRWVADLPKP